MATNPWGVTTSGERMGSYSGDAVTRQSPLGGGLVNPQQTQTFSQMQKAGVARPPAPTAMPSGYQPQLGGGGGYPASQPASLVPGGAPARPVPMPAGFQPSINYASTARPRPTVPPSAIQPMQPGQQPQKPGQQLPDLMSILTQRFMNPQGSAAEGGAQSLIMKLLGQPSGYDTDEAKRSFEQGRQALDEGYNVDQQKLREEMARRGLSDSTVYGGRLGDLSIQHGRDLSNLQGNILSEQARSQAADRQTAIQTALGFDQYQRGNVQQALQNLLGFGQQSFQNQLATANQNSQNDNAQVQLLLQLLGAA